MDRKYLDYMKHTDQEIIKILRKQSTAEKIYINKFIEARKKVKQQEEAKLTAYQKFKKQQDKEAMLNNMLNEYLNKS